MDAARETRIPGAGRLGRGAYRALWLAYLLFYPLPWFFGAPIPPQAVAASVAGVAVFLVLYFVAYSARHRTVLPYAVGMALIGFGLSFTHGSWSVFNVFAAILAAREPSRPRAMAAVVGLTAALVGFGLLSQSYWQTWVFGLFFSVLGSGSALFQADLERRNRQLLATQDQVRTLAAAAERERIARDLHDLLGHTLTLVAVKADLAARLLDHDPVAARREIDQVAATARDALAEVRSAVAGMHGAALAPELERARTTLAAAGVAAGIDAVPVLPQHEAIFAMTLREAVTNVIRHAGASGCSITVRPGVLTVVDDGGAARQAVVAGAGLVGMRARLEAAGGGLRIERGSAPGPGGVRLVAMLP